MACCLSCVSCHVHAPVQPCLAPLLFLLRLLLLLVLLVLLIFPSTHTCASCVFCPPIFAPPHAHAHAHRQDGCVCCCVLFFLACSLHPYVDVHMMYICSIKLGNFFFVLFFFPTKSAHNDGPVTTPIPDQAWSCHFARVVSTCRFLGNTTTKQ